MMRTSDLRHLRFRFRPDLLSKRRIPGERFPGVLVGLFEDIVFRYVAEALHLGVETGRHKGIALLSLPMLP